MRDEIRQIHSIPLGLFAVGGQLKQHFSGRFRILISLNLWLQGKTTTIFHTEDKISGIWRQEGGAKVQPLRI